LISIKPKEIKREDMKNGTYQHKDILKVFSDLSPRSLVSWTEKGLLTPDHGDATGRGTMRKYSFDNVIQAGVIRELMAYGLTFREIILVADHWKSEMKRFDYDCVLFFQRATFKSSDKRMPHRWDVGVVSKKKLDQYKASSIFETFVRDRNEKELEPSGPDVSYTGALFINVTRIYQLVESWLSHK
jgi:DNA-binding transcriptional MerR regulator